MNLETRQLCGTCPSSKQNKTSFTCKLPVPTMGALAGNDHFQVFCKITHTPGIPTPGDFHPDRSGGLVVPRWKSPDVMFRMSFLFPCWCLDIAKIDKTALIYSFHISIWGGLEHCLGGLARHISPVATRLAVCETWESIVVPRSIWLLNNCRKVFAHFGQVYLMCLIFVKNLPIFGKVD